MPVLVDLARTDIPGDAGWFAVAGGIIITESPTERTARAAQHKPRAEAGGAAADDDRVHHRHARGTRVGVAAAPSGGGGVCGG